MSKVAYIDAGVVTGIYMASLDDQHPAGITVVDVTNTDCGIGWLFEDGALIPPPEPAETLDQVKARLQSAVQNHLDGMAIAHGYDSIVSACSYAGAPNPFQADGQAFLAWRGAVWQHCYQVLADVQAGNQSAPTEAELIASLPALSLL